jgi:hypothetical protein
VSLLKISTFSSQTRARLTFGQEKSRTGSNATDVPVNYADVKRIPSR